MAPRLSSWLSLSGLLSSFLLLRSSLAQGPAIASNFPDPCLAQSRAGTWYAFSTQTGNINVQMASSPDFDIWTLHEGYDALPTLPAWTVAAPNARVWAPDVAQLPNGDGWIMYFAAVGVDHPLKHCIGTATSPNVTGPYVPNPEPLICDLPNGGNIDPNLFADPVNGNYYLIYKTDGNSMGHGGDCGNTANPVVPTPLYLQQVSKADLVTLVGAPQLLGSNVNPVGSFQYDGPNTERPSIAYRNGTYYMLYNSQCYAEEAYKIRYVSCIAGEDTNDGINGCDWPALKGAQQGEANRIFLQTNDIISGSNLYAPGSMDTSADSRYVVFHGDVNPGWFNPGHEVNGQAVARSRGMYAAVIDYVNDTGDLNVVSLM